jgi:hypothetical protein
MQFFGFPPDIVGPLVGLSCYLVIVSMFWRWMHLLGRVVTLITAVLGAVAVAVFTAQHFDVNLPLGLRVVSIVGGISVIAWVLSMRAWVRLPTKQH